uniref:Uncharacterized protein n=1 Tax=Oryza punctata TaxID=4537 RepID=A0A0E0L1Y1_ORYPU
MATRAPVTGSTTVMVDPSLSSISSSAPASSAPQQAAQSVVLRLKRRPKKVTWKEGTVDNESLGRKSSKRSVASSTRRSPSTRITGTTSLTAAAAAARARRGTPARGQAATAADAAPRPPMVTTMAIDLCDWIGMNTDLFSTLKIWKPQ